MFRFYFNDEFFGSTLFDAKTQENLALDQVATALLRVLCASDRLTSSDFDLLREISREELSELLAFFKKNGLLAVDLGERSLSEVSGNRLRSPLRVFFDITYACNLRCMHCFTDSGTKSTEELSLREKLSLAQDLAELGVHRISIAGGEPFVSPDLFPFVEKCRALGMAISITTNGTLIDEQVIAKLNELQLKSLTVSIDGVSEKSIGKIRGMTAFERATKTLESLKENYLGSYSIKATLMKPNLDELEQIVLYGMKCGCRSVKFNCVRLDGRANKYAIELGLSRDEYIQAVKTIEALKGKYRSVISVKGPLNIYSDEPYDYIRELGFGCFAGKESICIDPLGNVRPCSHFPDEFICGNVRNQSVGDIWRLSSVLQQFSSFEGNETCRSCQGYDKCRSGCRFRAFCAGDINGIDPYCFMGMNNKC